VVATWSSQSDLADPTQQAALAKFVLCMPDYEESNHVDPTMQALGSWIWIRILD
jgi:hypothetical protein